MYSTCGPEADYPPERLVPDSCMLFSLRLALSLLKRTGSKRHEWPT